MDYSNVYKIKDGDSGKTVADGLQSNFEIIINGKQDKTDQSLNTTAKTIPGAINELLVSVTSVADSMGNIGNVLDEINGEVA